MNRQTMLLVLLLLSMSNYAQAKCELSEKLCEAQAEYEGVDGSLNKIYQKILVKINSGGFEDGLVSRDDLLKTLKVSQRTWLRFRDANCHAYYTLFSGGTSRNLDLVVCQSEMTKERITSLRKIYLEGRVMGV